MKPLLVPTLFAGLFLLAAAGRARQEPQRLELGVPAARFHWVPGWARLPAGMKLGNTHGCVVVDREDNVYLNTDSEHAVVVFDSAGRFLRSFGKELAGGLHGMQIVREGDAEFLYAVHTARHEALKMTLAGEILWRVGWPADAKVYGSADEYRPTSIAVRPDGGFFVADGYGASWIHEYDREHGYLRTFGGAGSEVGRMQTPHGLAFEGALFVADRENHRVQRIGASTGDAAVVANEELLRRPCHLHLFGELWAVADLAGRVTLLERDDFALVTHLGENPDPAKWAQNGVPSSEWKDGEFIAPHCANWDSKGNLYVTDWVAEGRISKLARLP
jgi:hypothetical protein